MMTLHDLLKGIVPEEKLQGLEPVEITGLSHDSRNVQAGNLYIAFQGGRFDGHDYISEVCQKGVKVIVGEKREEAYKDVSAAYISMEDVKAFIPKAARRFYGDPCQNVKVIGVTGTNGKTTITYLLESILNTADRSNAVIGTVNYRIGENILPSKNTTPGVLDMQRLLHEVESQGSEYCVMEVSSHALDQGRVKLIDFQTGIFTNLTTDHLDYHHTHENYFSAKAKLFSQIKPEGTAVINADDSYGRKLFSKTDAKILTYGIRQKADLMAEDIVGDITGTRFKLRVPDGEAVIKTKLVGEYNIYNILAAVGAVINEGISLDRIKQGIEYLTCVPGRLERVDCGQDFSVFIDYAHTQDAMFNVLKMLKETSDARLVCVFGCGGDRDKSKRAEMGRVACEFADYSYVTSDNPRSEDPQKIIDQIVEGFDDSNYEVILNRKEAIETALKSCRPGDIVLISGKGHENYQVFKDTTLPFNEKKIITQCILN